MSKGVWSLSPLLVFVTLYLVTSIVARDFYKMPITVAFMAASVWGIAITRGKLIRRINVFSRGAGSPQLLLMVWIFALAGAFANSAKEMGCIDATVNLMLSLLPSQMLLAGLFVAACFISLSIGTSVGTIVALTPIAAGVAAPTGIALPLVVGAVVGGSFFGDNLSFISDTTIVATQTQGCQLNDKFRVNSFIVIPPAMVILALYLLLGRHTATPVGITSPELVKVLPYLMVLGCAIAGMNVMAVLVVGIVLTGIIGLSTGSFDIYDWLHAMGDGIAGMGDLIIISLMAGGLLEVIRHNGGIDFIIGLVTRRVRSKRGAELSIAVLVCIVDVCTANNTVAIITVGGIARKLGERFGIDSRKCASLLDTFSCAVQGIIPYGGQLLIAAGLAGLSPVDIVPSLYYPAAIGVAALLAILLRYPRRYS